MMINFIAFALCALTAIYYGINGKVVVCLIELTLAALNLELAIKWIVSLFNT